MCQPFIGQALVGTGADHAVEPVHGGTLHVAVIQAKGEFINISAKMFRRDLMVDASQPALENRPNALDSVHAGLLANELADAMVDGLVIEKERSKVSINRRFIRVNGRADLDIIIDGLVQIRRISIRDMAGLQSAATLTHAENNGLADRTAPHVELLGLVLIAFLAADVGFINFDYASQLFQVFTAASLTQPVKHEPSGLLSDSDFFGKLKGRNTLASRDEQVHGVQPLVKWDMGPLKDRSSPDGKILIAIIASIVTLLAWRDALAIGRANGALDSIRPQARFKISSRRLFVGEHLEQLKGADRDVIVHV